MIDPLASLSLYDKAVIAEYAEAKAWSDYFSSAPPEIAEQLRLKVQEIEGAVILSAPGIDDPFYNRVIGLGLRKPATPELIDAILECLSENGASRIYFQICPAVHPVDTLTWLESRGFYPNGSWVKLIRGNEMPPFIQTGLDIQVIDADQSYLFTEIITEVFGLSYENSILLNDFVGRSNWSHYIAYDQGYPIAAAAMFRLGEVAWLGFMGTRIDHRGKGAQNALVTRRIFDAVSSGCKWIVSDTLEHSFTGPNRSLTNLERLGFQVAYWRINFQND